MSTNYMTLIQGEISDIEPRLWRLRQAIDVPDPQFEMSEISRELMQMRYDTTLRLYRILLLQREMFGTEMDDAKALMEEFGSAERILDATEDEPDYKSMEKMYRQELSMLDETNRFVDCKWMSITRPQDSLWKDYPNELKKALKKEADSMLKKTMSRKEYARIKDEDEKDGQMDYFQRYEASLEDLVKKGLLKKSEKRKMVAAERKYYRDLEKWNRNGGL